ncbi:MAG: putative membrane protein [uncultured archaeon A07HB70]|nr:MAG: putative membrane protein [uncultured archaeon A07HB70]
MTDRIEVLATASEDIMRWLELGTAYFLVALFGIGVFDLGLSLAELMLTGQFTDPSAVIDLIDTVLILLIIVEVFQTVIAFSRDEPVTRIVITAALIAIARKVITFRPGEFGSTEDALISAVTFSLLLTVLIGGFYIVRQADPIPFLPGRRDSDDESTSQPSGEV